MQIENSFISNVSFVSIKKNVKYIKEERNKNITRKGNKRVCKKSLFQWKIVFIAFEHE